MQQEVIEIQRVLSYNTLLYQVMKIASKVEKSKVREIALRLLEGELNKEVEIYK